MNRAGRVLTWLAIASTIGFVIWLGWPWPRIAGFPHWLQVLGVTGWFVSLDPLDRWLAAFGTLLVAWVAAFQDTIRAWVWRPRLKLRFHLEHPYCCAIPVLFYEPMMGVKDPVANAVDAFQIRLGIQNTGNARAEYVEVHAVELTDAEERKLTWFLPMNLTWADDEQSFKRGLSPGTTRLCNLGQIVKPRSRNLPSASSIRHLPQGFDESTTTFLKVHTQVNASSWSNLIFPGKYFLELEISASNASPVKRKLALQVNGAWHEDHSKMFSESGVTLSLVD